MYCLYSAVSVVYMHHFVKKLFVFEGIVREFYSGIYNPSLTFFKIMKNFCYQQIL